MRSFFIYFLLASVLLLPACSDKNYDPENTLELNSDLIFHVYELYPEENSGYFDGENMITTVLLLSVRTEEIFPNFNYSIRRDVEIKDRIMYVTFRDVFIPEILQPATGPARTQIVLPENVEKIEFRLKGTTTSFNVAVSEEAVTFDGKGNGFVTHPYETYFRRTKNTFALNFSQYNGERNLYDAFIEMLNTRVSLTEFTYPDEVSIPWIVNEDDGVHFATKYYSYDIDSNFEAFGVILSDFITEYGIERDDVYILLTNYTGATHLHSHFYDK